MPITSKSRILTQTIVGIMVVLSMQLISCQAKVKPKTESTQGSQDEANQSEVSVNSKLSKITLTTTTTSFEVFQKEATQIVLLFSEAFPADITINWSLTGGSLGYFENGSGSITILKGENIAQIRLKPMASNPLYSEMTYSFVLTPSNEHLKLPQSFLVKLVDNRVKANPTISLQDGNASAGYSVSQTLPVTISNIQNNNKWCLSEYQVTKPDTAESPCVGGLGAAQGWYEGVPPTSFTLSVNDGPKTVYIWAATDLDAVIQELVYAQITLDTEAPTSVLSGTPSGASSTNDLNLAVAGVGVTSYKYKIGPSVSTICALATDYSADIDVSQNINTSINALADGSISVCVIGKDIAGNYQSFANATSYSWLKDTTPPTATLSGAPSNPSSAAALNVSVSNTDTAVYRYKVGVSAFTICTQDSGYSAETPVSQNITTDLSGLAEGNLTLCVVGKDSLGNSQSVSNATALTWIKEMPTEVNFDSIQTLISREGDSVISLTVQLAAPRAVNVTKISLQLMGTASQGGVDLTDLNLGEVSFNPGVTQATVQVSVNDDNLIEPIEYIDIHLNSIVQGNAVIGATNTRRIILKDNDPEQNMTIISGAAHNCIKTSEGKVKCWGHNAQGQLGLGDTANRGDGPDEMGANLPYVDLGVGVKVLNISAGQGGRHTCALLDTNDVKCWGHGSTWSEPGHMGYGTSNNIGDGPSEMGDNLPIINLGTSVKAKDIITSSFNSCVITMDDRAKCWGVGYYGANGNASTTRVGSSLTHMGNNLPYMDFGTDQRVLKISMGAFHRCVILDNLKLKCWGWNAGGQLGYEDLLARGDNANEMGENLPYVNLGSNAEVVDVVASTGGYFETANAHHTCALLSTGQVKCWGEGGSGQLGLGSTVDKGGATGTMGDSLPFVDLGLGRTATRIFASHHSTCAILDNNDLKCWGNGGTGQLGYNSTANKGISAATIGDNLLAVFLGTGRYALQVSGSFVEWGNGHRCAVLDNYDVKCWGKNTAGELGVGSLNVLGDGSGEMEVLQPIPIF